jgi:hypothetical protein
MFRVRPSVSSSQPSKLFRTERILLVAICAVFVLSYVALSSSAALRTKLGLATNSKSEIQQPAAPQTLHAGNELMRVSGFERRERAFSLAAPVAPTVTATKTDSLFADADNDTQADPGDTIKYTVNISASGSDATGVTFTDNVDPNTTFVPGSLTATPVAVDDTYSALGNVRISIAAPGVLGNDFTGVPTATITAPPSTSAQGGNVILNADGSFSYNPPAGFEGTDTFTYTLTNAAGSNNATVTINVSGMIWFIDNNASCPCDGRLTNPYNTIASFQAVNNGAGNNPAANDNIFIYESASSYSSNFTLLNGQKVIGQDASASLSSITGLTPPSGSDPLPTTNSANATIVNLQSAGTSITVGSGNTLTGFTGGSSTTDISGSAFGTLTISDVTLNGVGQALNLTNGTLAATFLGISSTNSTLTGISLTSVAGSLTSPTTTITNPTGIGLSVDTSSGSLNFGNTNASGSGSTGVSLTTNTGTITFGSLSISPAANQRGLLATNNTNTITSTSGAISTTGATAVEITRTVGTTPLAISQTSIAASGDSNGIFLSNTSGSFTVTGSSAGFCGGQVTGSPLTVTTPPNTADCTGGRITGTTGADASNNGVGVYLNNAQNVSLTRMRIDSHANFGILGTNVTGFTLASSLVDGANGTNTAPVTYNGLVIDGEASVAFGNLLGSGAITNSTISGGVNDNLAIINSGSSVLNFLNITGSTIRDNHAASGNDGLHVESQGTANTTVKANGNVFIASRGDHLDFATISTTTTGTIVFTGNNLLGGHPNALGQGITVQGIGTTNYNVSNNSLSGSIGTAINCVMLTGGSNTFGGTIAGNAVGTAAANSGSSQGSDLVVELNGIGTHNATVSGNTFRQYGNGPGVLLQKRNDTALSGPHGSLNVTFSGNVVSNPGTFASNGILLNSGTATNDNGTTCADIGGSGANTLGGSGAGGADDFRVRQRFATTVRLPGYGGTSTNTAAVVSFIQGQNTGSETGSATVQAPGGGFVGGAACATSPLVTRNLRSIESNRMLRDRVAHHVNASARTRASFDDGPPDILYAPAGQNAEAQSGQSLSESIIATAVQAAIERWRSAGISGDDLARLQAVTFGTADLPDGQLASTSANAVQIDESAAGYGWYVDPTPMEDSEFNVAVPQRELQANEYSTAFGKVDLMTVIMRQLGSVYRQGKESIPQTLETLMQGTLGTSIRRLPDSSSINLPPAQAKAGEKQTTTKNSVVARAKQPTSVRPASQNARAANSAVKANHAVRTRTAAAPMSFADVMLNIGTLPAGESVTIIFNAQVNDPYTGSVATVCNQGTVSGTNFASVLTDDPSVGGAADPTCTPIDLAQVSVAVSPSSVAEDGATNLVYTFTRTGSTASAMTVNFNVGGTASFTEPDYTQSGAATFTASSGTVTIPAGSATATVTIDPSADTTVESDETVSLTVSSGSGYTVGSPSSASATITNDDTDVSVAVSPASVAEDGATNLVYTFSRVGVTSSSLTVNFSIAVGGSEATFPVDYSQSGATTFAPPVGTVTFSPGSSTAIVTVDPTPDSLVEPDETVTFTVTSGTGYNVAAPSSATGTITNDDADVTVTVAPSSVSEDGPTNLVYTFTRTGFTALPVTVNFSVGGSAVFSQPDYTQSGAATYTDTSGTVLFGAGVSTAQVTIDPSADAAVEADETVVLTVTSGVGYNVGSPDSATGTITNDDTDVTVAVSPASVAEDGATNLVYTFTRAGVTSSSLTVNFSVGGSATFGASPNDYTQTGADSFTTTNGTVTFSPGSSTAAVTVNPETDSTVESDETVNLTVTAGTGYNVGSPASASGTITNDDTDVSVAVSPASVAEDGATNLVYTFTRNGVTSTPLTVNFSVGGTANFGASPNDYTETGATTFTASSGTVTFAANSTTATVTVNPETDTVIELDETVTLTLTSGAGYNVISPSSATGTIANDDADVSVTVSPAAVAEDGATNLVYTFTRTGFTAGSLTVNFTVGGSATFGASPNDYTVSGATSFTTTTGSVTFGPGNTTAQVTVDPETDTTFEPDETVIITLVSGAGYNAVSPNSATGTILNDDTLVSVVVSPTSTAEGGAPLVYTFTRTGPTTSSLTVNFSVGGSASYPADYAQSGAATFAPPNATVTFGVGSSTATVTVTPLADCDVEGSETVDFTVQPGTGYGVGSPSSASGTINNTPDSTPPTITLIPNVNMTLWPPNHQYASVSVTDFVASASDDCDASVNLNSVYILKITSDEVENGNGDGNTLNDIVIGGTCKTAQLRAERDGSADGRVYTITFKVKDSFGNFTTATAQVTVRKNPNTPAVDSGTHYTVNSICP